MCSRIYTKNTYEKEMLEDYEPEIQQILQYIQRRVYNINQII